MARIVCEPDISKLDGYPSFADDSKFPVGSDSLSIGARVGVGYLGDGCSAARLLGRMPACGRMAARLLGDWGVEKPEHTFTRRHRLLERVELFGKVVERLEEPTNELQKFRERADGQRRVAHPMRAGDDQAPQRDRRQHLDHREIERVIGDRMKMRLQM